MIERRGFFKSLLGVLALPFTKDIMKVIPAPVEKVVPVHLGWTTEYSSITWVTSPLSNGDLAPTISYWNEKDTTDPLLYKYKPTGKGTTEEDAMELWSGT